VNTPFKILLLMAVVVLMISIAAFVLYLAFPFQKSEIILPVTGKESLQQNYATPTPTQRLIPPVQDNVRAGLEEEPGIELGEVRPPASTVSQLREFTPTPTPLSAEEWKAWPEMPVVSDRAKAIYWNGVANGTDPNAFSVLGDCQSLPDAFLGRFDKDPETAEVLDDDLQLIVSHFSGSFGRSSPTVKNGSSAGGMLWAAWNDNPEKLCEVGETPIDCELRTHNPSIVFINLGTHWEARNSRYVSLLIEKIIAHGALPVLATKADNLELDERVNREMAELALQYDIPLWNFWTVVKDLPDHALTESSDYMLLNEEGLELRRISALKALNSVWEQVNEGREVEMTN